MKHFTSKIDGSSRPLLVRKLQGLSLSLNKLTTQLKSNKIIDEQGLSEVESLINQIDKSMIRLTTVINS